MCYRTKEQEDLALGNLISHMRGEYQKHSPRGGHDFTHAERTAVLAKMICHDTKTSPFIAQVAVLLHDIHRIMDISPEYESSIIRTILKPHPFSQEEVELIIDAIARHSQLNKDDDSELAMILKDADRVDCLGAIGVTRIGQHRSSYPPYNPATPFLPPSDTKEQTLRVLTDDFHRVMEWYDMLRMPIAIQIARPRFEFMKLFFERMKTELKELQ